MWCYNPDLLVTNSGSHILIPIRFEEAHSPKWVQLSELRGFRQITAYTNSHHCGPKLSKTIHMGKNAHKHAHRRRDTRGSASRRLYHSANKIIKLYPARAAVSATKSTLFSPSGQSTFYFLPSLQRRLPLGVDLVKSWLPAGPRDGGGEREEKWGGRGGEINLLNLFTLVSCTHSSAQGVHTSSEAEHAHGCCAHVASYVL